MFLLGKMQKSLEELDIDCKIVIGRPTKDFKIRLEVLFPTGCLEPRSVDHSKSIGLITHTVVELLLGEGLDAGDLTVAILNDTKSYSNFDVVFRNMIMKGVELGIGTALYIKTREGKEIFSDLLFTTKYGNKNIFIDSLVYAESLVTVTSESYRILVNGEETLVLRKDIDTVHMTDI